MVKKRQLISLLQEELAFIESGGYRNPDLWRSPFIFEDSGTCWHPYGLPNHCCTDCPLMDFVPRGRRNLPFPCRHIPLTPEGHTLESMYRYNSQQEIEKAVRSWLKRTISHLVEEENSHLRSTGDRHNGKPSRNEGAGNILRKPELAGGRAHRK